MLVAESGRLEQLAREFTEFGRLPEGPAAPVDLAELLAELARTCVPPTMTGPPRRSTPRLPPLLGHYDPLRRAFSNILRNAVEACDGKGALEHHGAAPRTAAVRIEIRDHGPGVPAETGRADLRSLLHREEPAAPAWAWRWSSRRSRCTAARSRVEQTPGGGATFVVRMRGR